MRVQFPAVTILLVAVSGVAAGFAGPQPPQFVRFQDPTEMAFSLHVPAGWRITGGLRRVAPTDVRSCVEAISPDGRIRVRIHDCDLPTFTEPNAMLQWTGFREGSWYSPGWGVQMMVRRYQPGLSFATNYANQLAAGSSSFVLKERRELPAVPSFGYAPVAFRSTSGEVTFACDRGGEVLSGYVQATTRETSFPGASALWTVESLHSFLAPPGEAATARTVLDRMVASFRIEPRWTAMQQAVTADTSRIVRETNEYVARIRREVYENRQRSLDRISQMWSDVNRGIVRLRDPDSGETFEAPSGHGYYWRMPGSREPFGTDSSCPPSYGAIPMIILR